MANNPTFTAFNDPYGIDQTATRMWLRGKLTFASGSYIAGGMLPNWQSILDSSGQAVLLPTYTNAPQFQITNSALTSNVATLTAINTLTVGQYVNLSGLTNLSFLNGQTLIVASRSGTTFTVAFTHANVASAADSGTAIQYIGPDDVEIHSVSGSGFIYQYNKSFATVQIFVQGAAAQDPLEELTAGALTGEVGDIIHCVATWAKA